MYMNQNQLLRGIVTTTNTWKRISINARFSAPKKPSFYMRAKKYTKPISSNFLFDDSERTLNYRSKPNENTRAHSKSQNSNWIAWTPTKTHTQQFHLNCIYLMLYASHMEWHHIEWGLGRGSGGNGEDNKRPNRSKENTANEYSIEYCRNVLIK